MVAKKFFTARNKWQSSTRAQGGLGYINLACALGDDAKCFLIFQLKVDTSVDASRKNQAAGGLMAVTP